MDRRCTVDGQDPARGRPLGHLLLWLKRSTDPGMTREVHSSVTFKAAMGAAEFRPERRHLRDFAKVDLAIEDVLMEERHPWPHEDDNELEVCK